MRLWRPQPDGWLRRTRWQIFSINHKRNASLGETTLAPVEVEKSTRNAVYEMLLNTV